MSVRIIFEVRQNGPKIDLRLETQSTPNATDRETGLAKIAKDCLDEMLGWLRESADEKQIPFTHTKIDPATVRLMPTEVAAEGGAL